MSTARIEWLALTIHINSSATIRSSSPHRPPFSVDDVHDAALRLGRPGAHLRADIRARVLGCVLFSAASNGLPNFFTDRLLCGTHVGVVARPRPFVRADASKQKKRLCGVTALQGYLYFTRYNDKLLVKLLVRLSPLLMQSD
jgi:hypothetical protein